MLSVIIASHNTKDVLRQTLLYLLEQGEAQLKGAYEVIVVDNASSDGTKEMLNDFPVQKIFLPQNRGFGAANNVGAKAAQGEFLLLLNSDVHLREKVDFPELIAFLKQEKRAGLTIRLQLTEKEMDAACHRGFPTPLNSLWYFVGGEKLFGGSYHLTTLPLTTVHEIDCPSAAFFLVNKKIFDEVGGFDEEFFFYAEDIDLCYRIKQKGYSIWYYPKFSAYHLKYQSGKKHTDTATRRKAKYWFYYSMKLYYQKHSKQSQGAITNFFVEKALTALIRWYT